jgi:hypothetical protein
MNGPFNRFEPITQSDTVDLPRYQQTTQLTDGVYVGASGSVVAFMADGTLGLFFAEVSGTILPIGVRRIHTVSTAQFLVALYQI